jgi:hypothetical protein
LRDGVSLVKILEMDGIPSRKTIFRWMSENKDFREAYALARLEQAQTYVDEIVPIADEASDDWEFHEERGKTTNANSVRRAALRVDTRKWIASKVLPKMYGLARQAGILEPDEPGDGSGEVVHRLVIEVVGGPSRREYPSAQVSSKEDE